MTTETFSYTGSEQTWTVPDSINRIYVELWGGVGEDATSNGIDSVLTVQDMGNGGSGGYVEGVMSVTPGETLYLYVGGSGSGTSGGWNGGGSGDNYSDYVMSGGGGGATDVRQGGNALSDRQVVAGGGGGGGGAIQPDPGTVCGGYGGYGGLDQAQAGDGCSSGDVYANGGGAGTQSSGGAGGDAYGEAHDEPGTDGSLLDGGRAYAASDTADDDYAAGGGGGGGYYGGGGGGSAVDNSALAGGGGGGSNYDDGLDLFIDGNSGDANGGDGQIKIHYDAVSVYNGSSWVLKNLLTYDGTYWRMSPINVQ